MGKIKTGRNLNDSDKKLMRQRLDVLRLAEKLGNEEVIYV